MTSTISRYFSKWKVPFRERLLGVIWIDFKMVSLILKKYIFVILQVTLSISKLMYILKYRYHYTLGLLVCFTKYWEILLDWTSPVEAFLGRLTPGTVLFESFTFLQISVEQEAGKS